MLKLKVFFACTVYLTFCKDTLCSVADFYNIDWLLSSSSVVVNKLYKKDDEKINGGKLFHFSCFVLTHVIGQFCPRQRIHGVVLMNTILAVY